MKTIGMVLAALVVVALVVGLGLVLGARRSGQSVGEFVATWGRGDDTPVAIETAADRRGPDTPDLFRPRAVGGAAFAARKPLIAHTCITDLDGDGRRDVLVADVLAARVTWLHPDAAGAFVEDAISDSIGAPVRVAPVDVDADGDLDVLVAAMGIMLPNNDRIGSVIVLENDGRMRFHERVLADGIARVTDVQPGDLDGDGDVDLSVGQFGYDQGEIRWMENLGDWRFESHQLLNLAGTIHSPVADMDGDGDLDIVALVSQEWEEVYVFENDGHGDFASHVIFGAATDDYCSSGIALGDLDGDGDVDVLYTNGDAFVATDYRPLPNHGVQWLENEGGLSFTFHRIDDYFGAYAPAVADLDGDGDLDGIAVSTFNYWDRPDARGVRWFENLGDGRFVSHGIAHDPTHLMTLDVGDLDGDGRPDLVTGGMALYPPFDRIERLTIWTNAGSSSGP